METPIFEIIEKAAQNQKKGIAFVMATVVEGVEKTPGRSGFKLLYYHDKSCEGTVGGGILERLVLESCEKVFSTKENALLEYELTETSAGIGMACGGIAKVFLEYFPPTRKAYIFGAGHLCRSVVPILNSIGFYCVVIDNREEFANKERIPEAREVFSMDYFAFLNKFKPTENDAILIFTHGHIHDFDILDFICRENLNVSYVGMIGSRIKSNQALEKIRASEYKGNLIAEVHTPIGLNIGKTTTQEIAIAITAEILAVYNKVDKIDFLMKNN